MNRFFSIILIIIGFSAPTVTGEGKPSQPSSSSNRRSLKGIPEVHFDAAIWRYFFRNNQYFRDHRLIGSEIRIEPYWLSWRDRLLLGSFFEVNPGFGSKKPGHEVVFDPIDINYALTTVLEYRLPSVRLTFGEDHRCFHDVDRKDLPTVYWNNFFISAHSPNYGRVHFYEYSEESTALSLAEKISWSTRIGYFAKKFFGLVQESIVNYENSRIVEAEAGARYHLHRWEVVALGASGEVKVGLSEKPPLAPSGVESYWRISIALESEFISHSEGGGVLFARFVLDDMPSHHGQPRFSDNRMLQLGVRVFR